MGVGGNSGVGWRKLLVWEEEAPGLGGEAQVELRSWQEEVLGDCVSD